VSPTHRQSRRARSRPVRRQRCEPTTSSEHRQNRPARVSRRPASSRDSPPRESQPASANARAPRRRGPRVSRRIPLFDIDPAPRSRWFDYSIVPRTRREHAWTHAPTLRRIAGANASSSQSSSRRSASTGTGPPRPRAVLRVRPPAARYGRTRLRLWATRRPAAPLRRSVVTVPPATASSPYEGGAVFGGDDVEAQVTHGSPQR
jgi:hypothetical protein